MLLHLILADTEFPNDNPWLGDPCGVLAFAKDAEPLIEGTGFLEEPVMEAPVVVQVPVVEVPVAIEATTVEAPVAVVIDASVAEAPVAIDAALVEAPLVVELSLAPSPLDELWVEDSIEPLVEALVAVEPFPDPPIVMAPRESGICVRAEPSAPVIADLDDEPDDIEVVQEFDDFDPPAMPDEPLTAEDPFAIFVRTLVEVAVNAGCATAPALLPVLLGGGNVEAGAVPEIVVDALVAGGVLARTSSGWSAADTLRATAGAWRAILCGKSEDFSACGSRMLDEWAADLVARIVGSPAKTEQLRRELRAHGVAAFGLVLAA